MNIKPIENHSGYFADIQGNIYSLWENKGQHGLVMTDNFKKLNFSKSKSGYFVVSFGRKEKQSVHRIIYQTFVGEIESGKMIRHLNDIKSDNRVCNLAIGDQSDNMADAVRNGVLKTKLTTEAVSKIRSLKGFQKRRDVAKEFGVCETTIKNIWNNHTWRAV